MGTNEYANTAIRNLKTRRVSDSSGKISLKMITKKIGTIESIK